MSRGEYVVTAESRWYEIGTDGITVTAACQCGDGMTVPDKGLGRAMVAAWKSRHQHRGATP